ncbi:MAG: M23 family metallopeptidase [Candidatus Gastranaerophilaceae bacterium]
MKILGITKLYILSLALPLFYDCADGKKEEAKPQIFKEAGLPSQINHKKVFKMPLYKIYPDTLTKEQRDSAKISEAYKSVYSCVDTIAASGKPVAKIYPDTIAQGNTAFIKIKSKQPLNKPYFVYDYGSGSKKFPIFKTNDSIYTGLIATTPNTAAGEKMIILGDEEKKLSGAVKLWVKKAVFGYDHISTTTSVSNLTASADENHIIGMALKTESDTAYFGTPPFQIPVDGRYKTAYGKKRIENGFCNENYFHKGIDISAPEGTKILPVQSGKVLVAQQFNLNGGTVIIDHGFGMTSAYLHMSKINVKEGQKVGLKDIIGEVGSTGHSTGPHLHFGLYINGVGVNPVGQWLNPTSLKKVKKAASAKAVKILKNTARAIKK